MDNGMSKIPIIHEGVNIYKPVNDCEMDVIMRAPTRKRKTPEPAVRPRIIKMTWDMDSESTTAMMQDVGVSVLATDGEGTTKNENTDADTSSKPLNSFHGEVSVEIPRTVNSAQSQHRTVLVPTGSVKTAAAESQFRMSPLMMYIDSELSGAPVSASVKKNAAKLPSAISDPWYLLSDEMVLSVFGWLSKTTLARCARVCKRWKMLVYDESLWKSLDLGGKTLKRGIIGNVLERGVAVLRLAKSEIQTPLHMHSISGLRTRSFKVQYLDLSMTTISTQGLEELLSNCYNLRRLSLENCELNSNVCRYIGQNQHIEVLNLCMCQGLTENALVPICNNLHKLDSLNIAWTNMSRGAVVYLVISLPATITKLNLSGCRDTLQDEDVLQLCGSCPHLSELDLSDAGALTSQSVEHIVQQLHWLRYLALSRCYQIPPQALALVTESRLLEAMDVCGMLKETAIGWLGEVLNDRKPNFRLNKCPYSSIARPTTGVDRTKIWGFRTRDRAV